MKSGELIFLGVSIVILGMLIIFGGIIKESTGRGEGSKRDVKGGGVVLIGPIPIIFGTDRRSASTVVVLAIILILVSFLFYRKW
jgi:uncharacterized protein (TIGR00304 family)